MIGTIRDLGWKSSFLFVSIRYNTISSWREFCWLCKPISISSNVNFLATHAMSLRQPSRVSVCQGTPKLIESPPSIQNVQAIPGRRRHELLPGCTKSGGFDARTARAPDASHRENSGIMDQAGVLNVGDVRRTEKPGHGMHHLARHVVFPSRKKVFFDREHSLYPSSIIRRNEGEKA